MSIKPSTVALLVLACVWLTLGCRTKPATGLGDGPPDIDGNTKMLAAFDPASLTGPGSSGLSLDAAVAGPPQPPEPPKLPAPAVVDYGPTAEASDYPNIQVRFNRPMVALGDSPSLDPKQLGFSISPAVKGELHWAEPTRLVFEPETELPLATEYKVSLVTTLPSVDGPALDVDLHWSFGTQAPHVSMQADYADAMSNGGRGEYHWKTKVTLDCDHDLRLSTLRKHLSVTARDLISGVSRPVDVRVKQVMTDRYYGYRAIYYQISPLTRWPADSEIVVTVDAKLTGRQGPRPIGHPAVYAFSTPAGVEAVGRHCVEGEYADGCELGPITVDFTAPITRAQAKHLRISPKPRGFDTLAVAREYDDDGRGRDAYHEVMLWGDFQRGQSYAITVDEQLRDIYGQPLVGEPSFEVAFIEPPPILKLHKAAGTFSSTHGFEVGIESRYVERAKLRVALLDHATHERLIGTNVQEDGWPIGLAATHEQPITLAHTGKFGWSSHALDLAPFSGGKPAAMLVEVAADSLVSKAANRSAPAAKRGLVQFTELGITAVGSVPGGVLRVARLRDDAAIAGAAVELIPAPGMKPVALGKTDADGLIDLPGSTEFDELSLLRASKGDDQLLVELGSIHSGASSSHERLRVGESVRTTVMTERPLYKPGERVRVMGWSAIATPHELSGLRKLPSKTSVTLELRDFRDELIAKQTVRIKNHGKFWATLQVPESAALGDYKLTATLLGAVATTALEVKDFPVPEFEVSADATRTDIHGGETTSIIVNASYYFGGRVPIQRMREADDCVAVDYRPPGLDPSFSVAPRQDYGYAYGRGYRPTISRSLGPEAKTGRLEYDISLSTGSNGQTQRCTHSVAVSDISDKQIGAETNIWVHPQFYLAAHSPRSLHEGEAAEIAIQTLDFDGKPLAVADIEVTLERSWYEPEYVTEDGKRRYVGEQSRKETLKPCKTKSDGSAACSFAKLGQGYYEIRVAAKQGEYVPIVTNWLWVSPKGGAWSWSRTPVSKLTISVDQPKPIPGQTIHARVQAPWNTGTGLVMLSKGGLHELRTFTLSKGAAELDFEVTDAWIPGAELHVVAIKPGDSTHHPALQRDQAKLSVASDLRQLAVSVDVQAQAQTREIIPIEIRVRDHLGKPVRGHVSVWAVDEAVLSLKPLVLPDFVSVFVVGFAGGLEFLGSYAELMLPYVTRPDPYAPVPFNPNWTRDGYEYGYGSGSGYGHGGSGAGYGGAGKGSGGGMPPARSKFESAPIFIADAELDEHGVAKVKGELPDNLTTFRLTAVASSPLASGPVEARFGTGDARVRVTRPLVVRAVMPRIMRPGDLAEVGLVVDNLRGGDGTVDLEFMLHDAEGIIELLDKPRVSATVEAGGQLRMPFRIRALTTGEPEIEIRAVLREKTPSASPPADALRLPLPVEPERTLTDRVAVYGSLADDGAAMLPFAIPSDADPKFGGLSVSVGSTLLGGLEDAVAYLVQYPYGCLEQTASSLLPLIPLGQLAKDYPLGIDDVDRYVNVGIARIRAMQLPGGGFSYWPGGTRPAPYASAYATFVLGKAAAAGYPVPPAMLDKADQYLLGLIPEWQASAGPSEGRDIEMALMLSTLAERGHAPSGALTTLYDRRQRLPVFSQATLLLALTANATATHTKDPRIETLQRELLGLVDEREGIAKVELTQRWTWYWDSAPRSTAMVLMALLRSDPMHPLASKLTRGLLETRRGGRWSNTQENAYALLALADYAAIHEAEEPRFDGRVWLGNNALASVHVEGRKFNFEDGFTPMSELLTAAHGVDDRLLLERAGQGRMYYRVGLEWASTATDKPAKSEGIRLTRILRDGNGVVGEDQAVGSGELLAIDVEMEIPAALDHVAIEIPLPAGIEAVDLELGKGSSAMKLHGQRSAWVSHQELRRDRAVLFADHLEPGKHHTTVFLRATTPGEYLMPAGSAAMMYYPEVYGRTTGRRLIVR